MTNPLEALVAEIEAGLDGVTPGPWRREVPDPGYTDDYVVTDHPDFQQKPHGNLVAECGLAGGQTEQRFQENSAHIARLSSENVRAILEDRRSLQGEVERLRKALDLAAAHAEICKLQGIDPATASWPEWSSPANTLRWFETIRANLTTSQAPVAGAVTEALAYADDIIKRVEEELRLIRMKDCGAVYDILLRNIGFGMWPDQLKAARSGVAAGEPPAQPAGEGEADPSFADALPDEQIRIWINACNHEPARQALRQLLAYRVRGVSAPLKREMLTPQRFGLVADADGNAMWPVLAGEWVRYDDYVAALTTPQAPVAHVEVIDLDQEAWKLIREAASQSSWIPPEYFMNDWVSDVCEFLRNRDDTPPPPANAGEREGWRDIETDPPPHDVPVLLWVPPMSGHPNGHIEARPFSTGRRGPGWSEYSQHSWATKWQHQPASPIPAKEG